MFGKSKPWQVYICAYFLMILVACGTGKVDVDRVQVVATTSIVADVVDRVGGEYIDLTVLLPYGADPHSFDPRPQDAAAVANADIIFANGAGLEEFINPLISNAGGEATLVEVSSGITLLPFAGEEHNSSISGDPHTWMDPNNVIIWVQNITQALEDADPTHALQFQQNATEYIAELRDLDAWIRQQVELVPLERRRLVSDHAVLGYFAEEYGFEQVGTIIAAFSTNASPSAQELAALEDSIRQHGVVAVFVGGSVNPALAQQVASDTGTMLVTIYTGSLSEPGGDAGTYLDFMRYNVDAIVGALK